MDKFFSFKQNKDNICDDGEFPILNEECNPSDYNNLQWLDNGWFYKLLLAAGIFIFIRFRLYKDTQFIIIAAIIVIAFMYLQNYHPTETFINQTTNNISEINKTTIPVVEVQSDIEKGWNSFWGIPSKLSNNKWVGGFVFFVVLGLVVYFWNRLQDLFEKILGGR